MAGKFCYRQHRKKLSKVVNMKIKEDLVCVLMLDIFLESNKREENITLDVVFLCGFLTGLLRFL